MTFFLQLKSYICTESVLKDTLFLTISSTENYNLELIKV